MARQCRPPFARLSLLVLFTAAHLVGAFRLPDWRFRSNRTGISCITDQCPFTTVCNPKTTECECESDFLVAVSAQMPCLMRKYLGELCIHTSQCGHIDNAVCISNAKRRNELQVMPFKELFTDARMLKHPEKYLSHKEFGRCECKPGFWPNQNLRCESKRLGQLECTESHDCPDQNSHCDLARRKCACDFGHMYDLNQDRCLLHGDLLGVFCQTDLDCQARDEQMRCWMGICTCINNHRFGPFRGCGPTPPCKHEQTWNHFSKSCEPTLHNYKPPNWTSLFQDKANNSIHEWTQLSAEVWFKLLIFFIFMVAVFCIITRRKALRPSANMAHTFHPSAGNSGRSLRRLNASQANIPMSLPGRVQPPHAIHLRVNLAELDDIECGPFALPRPLTDRRPSQVSDSSLPTYESLDSRTVQAPSRCPAGVSTPPPSYDEVIRAKSEQSCAKDESTDNNKNTPDRAPSPRCSPNSPSHNAQ